MKRTFTFLMSLFLMVGTMWAQPEVGSWYRIKVSDQDLYLTIRGYNGAGEASAYGTVPLLAKALASEDQVWTVEESGTEGVYHLKSKSGYYITHGSWNINAYDDPATKGQVSFVASGETYKIKNVNTGEWWKTQIPGWGEDALHPFCNAGEDAAALFSFETVDLEEFVSAVELTYEFKYNGEVLYTQKSFVAVGNEWPAYTVSFPYGVSAAKLEGTITEEDKVDGAITKVIELIAGELPFAYAADYASIENWYCLKFHASQQNYLYYDGTENVLDATKTAVDASNRDAYAWAFIGNPFDGFKVVNKLAGADKRINAAQAGAVVGTADQVFSFTTSSYATNGFFMQATTGDYKERFNKQDGKVVYWSGADGGSTFMVDLLPETLTYTLTDAFGNVYTGSYEGVAGKSEPVLSGVVGCTYENAAWDGTAFTANVAFPFPVSNEQTINATMISSFKNNTENFLWRAVDTGITAQKGAEADSDNYKWAIYPAFAEGSFTFTIKNLGTGKFIYSTSADNSHGAGVVALADEGSVFTVEANNKFKLATGKYLSLTSSNTNDEQILGTWGDHGGTYNKFIPCEYVVVEYADEETINALFDELAKLDELSYDLDATWAALPAVVEKFALVESVVEQVESTNPVPKDDVEAATAIVANANAVTVYYNETYKVTAKAADDLLSTLEEGSENHTALSTAIAACDLTAVTTVAELEALNAALAEAVEANTPEVDPNDYTSYIQNADLSKSSDSEKVWNTDGTKGISDGMVKVGSGSTFDFSQTITLPAGQYKMTAKAAYRYGSDEAAEYAAIEAGTETHYAKLYAETEYKNYEVGVQNRWDGASETNYYPGEENGKPFASTVNNLFVPNSSDAVKAWFGKDMYVNELVFNVQEEGEVKIGIAKTTSPDTGDYANIGAWTLTRLGDAEFDLNEEDFDLDAPAYTDVTAQYIVNADLSSKDGWTVAGLENDGKFDVGLKAVEFYSGWNSLERPNGNLTQEITLLAGTYRLTGKAFFRQGDGPQVNPGKSLGYLVAGDNKALVKTLGSANGTAGNFTDGANALYANATFDNVLEFTLAEETKLTIGYEVTFDEMRSWFIVGKLTLESVQAVPGALVPIFNAQAMEFCQYSSQAMSALPAVNAKWEALCSTVLEINDAIAANERVLDVEVKRVMDEMTAMTAELKAIEEVYAVYDETKWAMFDIQDNSTPNTAEVKAAFDAAVDAASNVSEVTTVAELEAKIAEFEAARQAYVVNAVPAEGFTFDYTFLIANPSFETGDLTGWTVRRYSAETDVRTDGAAGVDGRYCFNSWWNGVYLTQDLVDIPDGVYRLTVALFGGDSGNDATAYIVANKDTLGVNLKNGNPYTDFSVETTVIDGKLHFATVGGNDDDTAENPIGTFSQDGYWWYKADNFRLTYTGSLPESVLLELKKEAFLARAAKFEEFINNDVDWNLTMINMTHLYPVQDEVLGNADYGLVGLVDRMDEVTEIAVLDEWMAEMDKVEAMLKDARVAAAEFSKWQGMIMDAVGFVDTYDEEAAMAAMQYLEFNVGYNCTSVEDIQTATTGAEQAYKNFVLTATPAEGHVFDMSFLLVNPNFDVNMDGWTPNKANRIGGEGYDGVGGIAEIGEWGAASWEASMSQTVTGLPNGKYVVKAAWMSASGIQMTFAANAGETTVTGIGDTGGNIAKNGTVVEMGQGHRGWQYVEVEGLVEDGTLTILVSSSAQAAEQWSNADAFELYYAGTVPSKVTLDKTEAALEIEEGKTAQLQLTATIEPADVTLKTLTWESDNEEVATVDANGLVTAVGEGQAVITVTTAGGAKAECVVNVSIVDAIDVVNADTETEIYDLSGRRVEKMQKGIYIVNGRKVVIK